MKLQTKLKMVSALAAVSLVVAACGGDGTNDDAAAGETSQSTSEESNMPVPIPERYRYSVVPHIYVDGASEAISFYERAFGATELFRIAAPDGTIVHAEFTIGDSLIEIGDPAQEGVFAPIFKAPQTLGATTAGLHVYVDDVDEFFHQAIAAGASEIQPLEDMFYGARQGIVADPFGHIWILLTQQEDVSTDEIVRRAEALFAGG